MEDCPPDPQPRPKLAQFMFERGLKARDIAPLLGCSHEQVRRVCLPFNDPDRRRANDKLKQKVAAWTKGAVGLADWEQPA